jgi:DNA replication protein DnaC
MSWDEEQNRRGPPSRSSSSEPERPGALFSRMPFHPRARPGRKQSVMGDAWLVPGSNPPDALPHEGDEAGETLPVIQTLGPGAPSARAHLPSPPGAPPGKEEPVCPVCKGRRWLRQDLPPGHPQFGTLVACGCLLERRRRARHLELLSLSRLTEEQRQLTLGTFSLHVRGVQQAYRKAARLAHVLGRWGKERSALDEGSLAEESERARPREWMVLVGGVGVGKTHLALAVANAALDEGIAVLFATVPDLLDHLRAAYAPDAAIVYDELFERMRKADLLVLDDLGTQRSSPWADEKLFQLLNHRYSHRLSTIITMNEKAWRHLDTRLQSRLSDRRLVEIVTFTGAQDYRAYQGSRARGQQESDDDPGGEAKGGHR